MTDFMALAEDTRSSATTSVPDVRQLVEQDAALANLKRFNEAVADMESQVAALQIRDAETQGNAVEMAGQVSRLIKKIDARYDELTKPARDFINPLQKARKAMKDRLDAMKRQLKRAIGDYEHRLLLEKRKAEAEMRRAQEQMQAKMRAEAEAAGVEPVHMPAPVINKDYEATRTDTAAAYKKTVWDFKVLDLAAVPEEYKVLDERRVKDAIKNGIREIAGLEIYETVDVRIRS